ncbi:hypothetical protein [Hugenholtzia roseola]|uniref:hypothetical protein n=1 Tax=Hugenholtzia roseola TaxID=1002 RepID=UPI0004788AF7|nr:hypothetical protein [Hugenholtzia roseola]
MHYFYLVVRLLIGLVFFVFGLNGFLLLIPVPEFHPFMKILVESKFLYVVKGLEIVGGLLLLSNRYVVLALTLLAPIVVSILLFHLLIDTRNVEVSVVLFVLFGFLIGKNWKSFEPLLKK